jgi:hypothetical protein
MLLYCSSLIQIPPSHLLSFSHAITHPPTLIEHTDKHIFIDIPLRKVYCICKKIQFHRTYCGSEIGAKVCWWVWVRWVDVAMGECGTGYECRFFYAYLSYMETHPHPLAPWFSPILTLTLSKSLHPHTHPQTFISTLLYYKYWKMTVLPW